jgi:predicted nucleic acid-binding protein
MKSDKVFFDTNILLYLLSADTQKADCAENLVNAGGIISVQVLNEFASVASRKLKMPYAEIRDILKIIRAVCQINNLTLDIHHQGLAIAEQYGFSLYDSLIVSAAQNTGCTVLYSEDMQHGQVIGTLVIINPFIYF